MKASKCFWVALCLLVGNFSTELWAQKNLEAVVQKCKADKTSWRATPHYNKKLNPLLSGTRKRLIK